MKQTRLAVRFDKISKIANLSIFLFIILFGILGYYASFYFHFLTVSFMYLAFINFIYCHVQKNHALLSNFGILAKLRYIIESIGPEFRQYLFASDTEERPFSRIERDEVYMKSKSLDSSSAFGTQLEFNKQEMKLRHSFYPREKRKFQFHLVFGEERGIKNVYSMSRPFIIGAMSYGSLGRKAILALSRGAYRMNVLLNTGEGGYPKYHVMEKAPLIFQIGTAKFGVRDEKGHLSPKKLKEISNLESVKMIEIKFSQGAKPGKGGILPKEKISDEIAKIRGVPKGKDVLSPVRHEECIDCKSTIEFIKKIQDISELPVGIKLCFGREHEFRELVKEMKKQNTFPDYIAIDGGEGGTGAAPKSFMDHIGIPLFQALPKVHSILKEESIRDRLKLICGGKLITVGKQFFALSLGADAIYIARGFMFSLGCIQSLQCNLNTCPVGVATHDEHLQAGLEIEVKAKRVENYIKSLMSDYEEVLASMGKSSVKDLNEENVYLYQH